MPLITKILQPDRFNSAVLSGYTLDALRTRTLRPFEARAAAEDRVMLDAVQAALDRMVEEGVLI
jgi:hypothetical protein